MQNAKNTDYSGLDELMNTEEVVNEELLDSLIAALNFKENENLEARKKSSWQPPCGSMC